MSTAGPVRLLGAGDIRALAGRLGVQPTKKLGQNFVIEPATARQIAGLAGPFAAGDVILEVGPGLGSLTLALLDAAVSGDARGAGSEGGTGAGQPRRTGKTVDAGQPRRTGKTVDAGELVDAGETGDASEVGGARGAGGARGVRPGATVLAVEIDPVLAAQLPATIAGRAPGLGDRVRVLRADAMTLDGTGAGSGLPSGSAGPGGSAAPSGSGASSGQAGDGLAPSVLAANLPYNVAVPVVLHLLATFPSIRRGVVMVQAEVADRMCAGPGSRVYGVPSAKLAWYATARLAGTVPRSVFWPVPHVDSKLVAFTRHAPPASGQEPGTAGAPGAGRILGAADARGAADAGGAERGPGWRAGGTEGAADARGVADAGDVAGRPGRAVPESAERRRAVFAVIDAAFGQRRKTLRAALATWAGSPAAAEAILRAAGVDPAARGEALGIAEFAAIAAAAERAGQPGPPR